jgi:mannosylglycerate hydrolase
LPGPVAASAAATLAAEPFRKVRREIPVESDCFFRFIVKNSYLFNQPIFFVQDRYNTLQSKGLYNYSKYIVKLRFLSNIGGMMVLREQKRYRVTLVSHTHWDRAWYCTFQEYRVRLVRLIDNLLDILKTNPDYRVYMLDGQMSVLDDYLEARPSKADELRGHCRSGRIQVGPWFVLADEFLVSPESLIRNLQLGHKLGEAYGGVMKIGYVPDGFGHIAQLPQILRGFGIDNAFFWRGMGVEGDQLGTEFVWCAPDGSAVTTILMPWGYHNVSNLGFAIHWGDTSQMAFDETLAQSKIDRAIARLTPMANTNALLLMNGIDHAEPEPRIPDVIAEANARLNDVEIVQGTLADHLANVRASGVDLPAFEGEFRWGRYSEILQGVYSTRIHLKQQNHQAEARLERYVEPLTALAWLSGANVPEGTPDLVVLAWRWLLLNHPHDDMYGCGIDEVHHEMAYRFSQSEQIGEALIRDSLRQIARQVDMTAQDGLPLVIYNPLGWERQEVVEAVADFDFDDPTADSFHIVNASGEIIPHYVLSDEQVFWMEVLKPNRKRRVTMLLHVTVPTCGYTTVYAKAGNSPRTQEEKTGVRATERAAENAYVAFSIAEDGGLTVTDKTTGQTYTGLNHFYDVEDTGDAYTHCPFPESHPISTVGSELVDIQLAEQSLLHVAFNVIHTLVIPDSLNEDRTRRSNRETALTITSTIRLYANQPGIYITTKTYNTAKDHKLTVQFPTGLRVQEAYVDESFMIAERDLKLPPSEGWVEDPTPLMHQRTFTDLSDGERGFAVLNRGLPSVEVGEDGTIALTLLRSVGWLSRDDLWVRRIAAGPLVPTPGAQCIGEYTFEYALLPHIGNWENVYQTAYNYNAPILVRRADTHPGLELREMNITRDDPALVTPIPYPRGGHLLDTHSFVSVDPPQLVLSAVYRSGDDLMVRIYNITREAVDGSITFGTPIEAAQRVNLAEETQVRVPVQDQNRLDIRVNGAEVYTVKVRPKI